MHRSLLSQRVFIIGGTGRMGHAAATAALAAGADVTIAARSIVSPMPNDRHVLLFDASDANAFTQAIAATQPFDHIVVTVAAGTNAAGVDTTSTIAVQGAFSRYWACYNALHVGSQKLNRTGSITLISGSSGRRPVKGYGIWTALHGAIEALARAAAIDLAPMRVNVVSPGGIEMQPDRQLLEHVGKAEDVAAMLVALMANPAITNAVVDVDSGERLGSWPAESATR